ncbi:MAG: hypothetical protein GWN07_18455, partial [Actinobacteria bacterium]|nr:hypothetical protein [Actinomycetota bacterium]NIU67405.1 hypothetical protein [Actinomycetota bacterium]NIW29181.1 hypothetical protein [Actinomycetota bacterium]NIX21709.1 hypothetical protein [Actinomycetota bacterium]
NTLRFFRESTLPASLWVRWIDPSPGRVVRGGSVVFLDWAAAVPPGVQSHVHLGYRLGGTSSWTVIAKIVPN